MVGLAGMHVFDRDVTQRKVDRQAARMGLRDKNYWVLGADYAEWRETRRGHEPERNWQAKLQPLQLRYFDENGRIAWLIPNCDVGGFPNLNWRQFGLPDSLVPHRHGRTYADSAWTIQNDLAFMTDRRTGLQPQVGPSVDGYLLVGWSYFAGRQSTRLARTIEKWRKHGGEGVDVRYVSVDSVFITQDTVIVEP